MLHVDGRMTLVPWSSSQITSSHRLARWEPGTLACASSSTMATSGSRRTMASTSISSSVTPRYSMRRRGTTSRKGPSILSDPFSIWPCKKVADFGQIEGIAGSVLCVLCGENEAVILDCFGKRSPKTGCGDFLNLSYDLVDQLFQEILKVSAYLAKGTKCLEPEASPYNPPLQTSEWNASAAQGPIERPS